MRRSMAARWIGILLTGSLLGACQGSDVGFMGGVSGRAPVVPPVNGYAEGEEILFIHTEASDSAIAKTLTEMMGSPVPVVPELARVPENTIAAVYVFTNGVETEGARGPLGFQPDVFDCPVGSECYTPLRAVHLVTWADEARAEVLTSAADVRRAAERGLVSIEEPGVVVNMPLLTWPGGKR
jgi:hypothetical protein